MVFIDIEKEYGRVTKGPLVGDEKREIHIKYINIIKDMYEGVTTNVKK